MSDVIAFKLKSSFILSTLGKGKLYVLEGILENEVAAALEMCPFPVELKLGKAIEHGENAKI